MLFREILNIFRRWLWLLILGALIGGLLGYLSIARRTTVFEAAAGVVPIKRDFQVKLEPRFETTTSDVLTSDTRGNDGLATLASVVTNEAIAETVFNELQDSMPPRFKTPSDLVSSVSAEVRDGIIRVKVRSGDPAFAAKLANAWARHYATYINRIYSGQADTVDLTPQVEAAKQRYQTAEAAVVDFIRANDVEEKKLALTEKQTMVDELLRMRRESLTGNLQRLVDRRTKTSEILTAAQVLKELQSNSESTATNTANTLGLLLLQFASVTGGTTTTPATTDVSTQAIVGREPQFQFSPRTLEEVASSPEKLLNDLDHLIAVLQQNLDQYDSEITTVSETIGAAKQLEQDPIIAGIMTEMRDLRSESAALDAQRQSLERERDLLWDGYNLLANGAEELNITAGASDGSVVRFAVPASIPRRPLQAPASQQIILGALVGFIASLAVAFLLEIMDDKVRRREDVEQVVQLPLLGLVPRGVTRQGNGLPIALSNSTAPVVESARFLRDRIESHSQASQVIVLTAVAPKGGASSLLANLAVVTAQAGRRVIVVDANVRSPQLHEWFGTANNTGLANLVANPERSVESALQPTMVTGLRVLTAGSAATLTPDILATPQMSEILSQLRQLADLVLIDTASAGVASDAVWLTEMADGVVFVARSGKSSVADIQHVRDAMERVSGRVIGLVLNYAPGTKNSHLPSSAPETKAPRLAPASQ